MRRVEDKIRSLCTQILDAKDDEEITPLLVELRDTLHQYVGRLRGRFADYPFVVERRVRNGVPPPDIPTQENKGKKPSPTNTVEITSHKTRTAQTKADSKTASG